MKHALGACLLALVLATGAASAQGARNALAGHPSPYLSMHADDPVQWQTWGAETLAAARQSGRLLLVSVGYFSCHWCHVMHRESFRNAELAAFINEHFVAVKVDRELQPALDAHLIDFVERTRGQAGWPLNVFLTPEGYPLTGVTYLPPQEFRALLERLAARWQAQGEALRALAEQGAGALAAVRTRPTVPPLEPREVARYAAALRTQALELGDELAGGFGQQNKFPNVPQLRVLLAEERRAPDARLRAFLRTTLHAMRTQGLRDHLGGGFFRYTVDPTWQTPHFEKMLYDNAQLAILYLEAAEQFGEPALEQVALDTLDFVLRELAGEQGGLVSSLSAVDATGEEGAYYLWDTATLRALLDDEELTVVRAAWGAHEPPPFEQGYLPLHKLEAEALGQAVSMTPQRAHDVLTSAHGKLLAARAARALPRDHKRLAAWNGLALEAFARAARSSAGVRYRTAGRRLRSFLAEQLWDGARLARSPHGGLAALEDYAYVARGLYAWAALTGERGELELVRAVCEAAWRRFRTEQGWRLDDSRLLPFVAAEPILSDGPMPSPAAVLLELSLALSEQLDDTALGERALAVLRVDNPVLATGPFFYATHIGVLTRRLGTR